MICPPCREAADKMKPKLHRKCNASNCACQHRTGDWIDKGNRWR